MKLKGRKMKIKNLRKKICGFTIFELRMVIAIIALLAAMLYAGISGTIISAKKARARATMSALVTACRAYNTQYGTWPSVSGTVVTNSGPVLVNCLKGIDGTLNPREIGR